jgi:hypothetical protein
MNFTIQLLQTIALLCQATPGTTSTGSGSLWSPSDVRKSQAICQVRLLMCAKSGKSKLFAENLEECVEMGKVRDNE